MDIKMIIVIAGYIALFLLFCITPVTKRHLFTKAGKKVFAIHKTTSFRSALIMMLGFLLIGISYMQESSVILQIIIVACALMGEYIAISDLTMTGKSGIYENGLLIETKYIPYDEIMGFPQLNITEGERSDDGSALIMVTKKNDQVKIAFKNATECKEFTDKLFEHKPELKP